jgi:hypothetical protein
MYGMLVVLFLFFTSVEAPLQRAAMNAALSYVAWVGSLLPAASAGAGALGAG